MGKGPFNFLIENTFSITDKIIIQSAENNLNNIEFQAKIIDQKYKYNSDKPSKIGFKEIKYLLFTKYNNNIANMNDYHIAPIFELQKEHIWYQNRKRNFNDLTKIDIDKNVRNKLDPNTPWKTVKEIVNNERENWGKKENEKFHELLDASRSQQYLPVD